MTTVAPKWDELVPLPIIFDPKARITLLQSTLIPGDPHYEHPQQHPNIRAAIALYESGELDGREVFISGGKVVSKEEAFSSGLPVWSEVSALPPINPKCVLTDDLGRVLPSTCSQGLIPVQPANERAFRETRLFFFLVKFSYLSSLALDRSSITNSLRWTRHPDEDAGIMGYGVKRVIYIWTRLNGVGRQPRDTRPVSI